MAYDTCVACGAPTVHMAPERGFSWSTGASGGYDVSLYTGRSIVRPTPVTTLVCTTCGHFRQFVADPAKLAEIAQAWPKVPPAPPPPPG